MDKKETNEELFRRLFTTFYDRLYGFALSRVLSRDAAADITNEVFCRLWEQFDRLDFSTSPLPLLYTMTSNRCSDLLRQKTAKPTGGDTDAENVQSEDTMAEVMEREYNVTVIFADRDAAHYHFSFRADRNAPLSETGSLLNQIGTVRVQTDARNRRVIVRKR